MSLAQKLSCALLLLAVGATTAGATLPVVVKRERVPNGALEQTWIPGFGVGRTFTPLVLPAGNPAIPNPSGDNTVAVLQNNAITLGGIAACTTDPNGFSDYEWEADFFTGDGNTRRGIIVRADPGFSQFYQLVINAGLFLIRFRKFVGGTPVVPDLASWTANLLPGGVPATNTWHHLAVIATGNTFHCFFDGTELTAGTLGSPVVDTSSPILTGAVGAYNFSASVGEVPAYFDDLVLSADHPIPTRNATWGGLKRLYH